MPIKYPAIDSLMKAGITKEDAYALRRISITLHGWFEHECNGTIQREEESGLPYWYSSATHKRICRALDRESGAMKRLAKIVAKYPGLDYYVQGDPRGCALYILRSGDVPSGSDKSNCYNCGIAVY